MKETSNTVYRPPQRRGRFLDADESQGAKNIRYEAVGLSRVWVVAARSLGLPDTVIVDSRGHL